MSSNTPTQITDTFVDRFTDMGKEEQKRRLRKMDVGQLQEMKIRLQERIDSIEAQLQEAKQKAARDGEYADQDWFNAAKYAKKAMGRTIQYIQMLQSRRSGGDQTTDGALNVPDGLFAEALKKIDSLTWKQFFVEEAKRHLDEETYTAIAEAAGERTKEVLPQGLRSR